MAANISLVSSESSITSTSGRLFMWDQPLGRPRRRNRCAIAARSITERDTGSMIVPERWTTG